MAEAQTIPAPIECPFCGNGWCGVASDPTDSIYLSVLCPQCGATGPKVKADIKSILPASIKAIELWNNRHATNPK